ncbi:zinc-dependent peptidase [Thioalkalivibrio sp. ALE31]|uniref:M90 family metallopeptidase n=1 Tax=Thioalkalivibrio sp. ALE31 TaxID=1158182 RepID=UPI000371F67E|nr:M90 family metallopeptidase [Thioalkalivibrio sp. ALE31]
MNSTPQFPLRGLFRRLLGPFAGLEPEAVPLDNDEWEAMRQRVPFIARLTPEERARLRELIGQILAQKEFIGIAAEPEPWQCQVIAAYAALPILELGLAPYRDWRTLILYPDTFVPEHEWVDEAGIVHQGAMPQSGEAWERGPVILSWNDVARDGAVVVHEMTHVLDAGNGEVNGFPPLPRGQSTRAWTEDFSRAFDRFVETVEAVEAGTVDESTLPLDPYAATAPEEFLAVAVESFFFEPARLRERLPAIYDHLVAYFGQEPHRRGDWIASSTQTAPEHAP